MDSIEHSLATRKSIIEAFILDLELSNTRDVIDRMAGVENAGVVDHEE